VCEQAECVDGVSPEGTACADCGGDHCNGKGYCVKSVTCDSPECPWSRSFGDWRSQFALGLAVDAAGTIVISGPFEGTLDFDGAELTSTPPETHERWDGFVAKLAPNGSARGVVAGQQAPSAASPPTVLPITIPSSGTGAGKTGSGEPVGLRPTGS
jgi:hypothetical protein